MKQRWDMYRLAVLVCVAVYAWVVLQLFLRNLVLDTDYPFHMHNIWAVSNKFLPSDPFLNGGHHFTIAYGAPSVLVGGLIYPLAGVYTVAILLTAAIPAMWCISRRVFRHFATQKISDFAAILVLLNPFTVYYFLTAKLPFLWGTCLAFASIYFYLERRGVLASLVGAVAVITHPLVIFLLGAALLLDLDFKRWLKPYSLPTGIFTAQLLVLFTPFGTRAVFLPKGLILAAALAIIPWLKRGAWPLCALGFSVLAVTVFFGALGLPTLPTAYFDRLAFLALLLPVPLAITKVKSTKMKKHGAYLISLLLISTLGITCVRAAPIMDDPEVYRTIPGETLTELRGGYVRYACDGSALYELPIRGVKLSNAGQEVHEVENVDPATYAGRLENENVSFILVYTWPDENAADGWYLEEKLIRECGYPLVYSADNLRIYEVIRERGSGSSDNYS